MIVKTSPVGSLSIDELIIAQAFMGIVVDRIHENGHDLPESVKQEQRAIERELDERLVADRQKQLAILKSRREGLLTQAEKKAAVDTQIAELEVALGLKPASKKAGR